MQRTRRHQRAPRAEPLRSRHPGTDATCSFVAFKLRTRWGAGIAAYRPEGDDPAADEGDDESGDDGADNDYDYEDGSDDEIGNITGEPFEPFATVMDDLKQSVKHTTSAVNDFGAPCRRRLAP